MDDRGSATRHGLASGEFFPISHPALATIAHDEGSRAWWATLPRLVAELSQRWALDVAPPYSDGSCSWVAPATRSSGEPAVLKISWPHREAAGEATGLRAWDGRGAVRLLEHDEDHFALLIERCVPGRELAERHDLGPEHRLEIGAGLLRELWSAPVSRATGLERLDDVAAEWAGLVEERMHRFRPPFDAGLVRHGARLLRELPASATRDAVLHGDFNPGNVLSSRRGPWLAIDAKSMIGDPAYDPWPLVEQIDDPFAYPDPLRIITERFTLIARLVNQDVSRLAAWSVARRVETALWLVSLDRTGDAEGVMAEASKLAVLAGL